MDEWVIKSLLFFIGFIVTMVWLLGNRYSLRERINFLKKRHTIVATLFEAFCIYQLFGPPFFPLPQGFYSHFFQFLGVVIFTVGASLAIWARRTMGKSWGMPAQHDITVQKKLIKSGPFAFSRNPIYLGLIFMFIGFELALGSYLLLLTLPLSILMYRSVLTEEKLLEKHFGREYQQYKRRVPRFLLF